MRSEDRWPCQNLETSFKTQKLSLSISYQSNAPRGPRHGEVPTSYVFSSRNPVWLSMGAPQNSRRKAPLIPAVVQTTEWDEQSLLKPPRYLPCIFKKKKAININKDNYIIYILKMKFNQMLIKLSGKSAHNWKLKNTLINNYEIKGKSQVNFKKLLN